MNVVFISPNFPPNFYRFCTALRGAGANVPAIGDAEQHDPRPELREALSNTTGYRPWSTTIRCYAPADILPISRSENLADLREAIALIEETL